jgi:hypothetical protein
MLYCALILNEAIHHTGKNSYKGAIADREDLQVTFSSPIVGMIILNISAVIS